MERVLLEFFSLLPSKDEARITGSLGCTPESSLTSLRRFGCGSLQLFGSQNLEFRGARS